jgi:hypothetical protein
MGVKQAGIPARDYGNNRPRIAVKLYEGNLVYNANGIGEDGRTKDMWTVSAPITKECYVELHEDSDARHIIVKPASNNSTSIIGKLIINPKMQWTVDWTGYDKNRLPRANKTWGNYSPRTGTVEFFGDAIDYVDVPSDNSAISPFDSMVFTTGTKFNKKGSGTSNTKALGKKQANKGGKLPVLVGFHGIGV